MLYVRWLYSGELQIDIPASRGGKSEEGEEDRVVSKQVFKKLAAAYIFGEKVMDVSFKNTVIPKFIKSMTALGYVPNPGIVAKLYMPVPLMAHPCGA